MPIKFKSVIKFRFNLFIPYRNEAYINIHIDDVNNSPPKFTEDSITIGYPDSNLEALQKVIGPVIKLQVRIN